MKKKIISFRWCLYRKIMKEWDHLCLRM
jgi:hypothetical protein